MGHDDERELPWDLVGEQERMRRRALMVDRLTLAGHHPWPPDELAKDPSRICKPSCPICKSGTIDL